MLVSKEEEVVFKSSGLLEEELPMPTVDLSSTKLEEMTMMMIFTLNHLNKNSYFLIK